MTEKEIDKYVCVEPSLIHVYDAASLRENLFNKARDIYLNTCTKDDGYIIEILDLVEILDNKISRANARIIFKLRLKALIIKPEVDKPMDGIVSNCLPNGVFIMIENCIKVMITPMSLKDYFFNNKNYVKDDKTISVGTPLTAIIKKIRYEKNKFTCIGELM